MIWSTWQQVESTMECAVAKRSSIFHVPTRPRLNGEPRKRENSPLGNRGGWSGGSEAKRKFVYPKLTSNFGLLE